MEKREFLERKSVIGCLENTAKYYDMPQADEWTKGIRYGLLHGVDNIVDNVPTITDQEIVKPLFDEFKEKLSKWLYHNSESVCGDSMIDIYYLEGHIDEILYEMGIIGEVEE